MLYLMQHLALIVSILLGPTHPIDKIKLSAWTIEDGLPMNSITTISQTPDGYLWVGTQAGLARFDGIEFDLYNQENVPALRSEIITSTLVDASGTLWIGTRGGGLTKMRDDRFDTYTKEDGLLDNRITSLLESRDGTLWIGTRKGLNLLNHGKFFTVPLIKDTDIKIQTLMQDRQEHIWVGTEKSGIFWVEKESDQYHVKPQGQNHLDVEKLLQDRSGNIWAATHDSGLLLVSLDPKRPSAGLIVSQKIEETNPICTIMQDQAGNLWVGVLGKGIGIVHPGNDGYIKYYNTKNIGHISVIAIFEDRENIIWAGSLGRGLFNLRQTRIITYTTEHGLANNMISSVLQDSRGSVWIGNGRSVGALTTSNPNRIRTPTRLKKFSHRNVMSIAEHPSGTIWLGTMGAGLFRFNQDANQLDRLTTQQGLSVDYIFAVYLDRDGVLWAGGNDGGLHRYDGNRFQIFKKLGFRINTFMQDRRGGLWIGTWGGGVRYIRKHETISMTPANGLSHEIVMAFYEDQAGMVWIATLGGGINLYHHGVLTPIDKNDGLPDNYIYCILEDQQQRFWMSSNRGIFRVRRKELLDFAAGKRSTIRPISYSIEDGMQSIECNGGGQPACWKTTDGRLWFPTTKGISVIDPHNLDTNIQTPSMRIKKAVIDSIPYPVNQKAQAPAGRGDLEIAYTGIGFTAPQKTAYKYKLEGLDETWTQVGKRRNIRIAALPPGDYRFRVTACNNADVCSQPEAIFEFRIQSYFYQTCQFVLWLCLGLASLSITLYFSTKKILSIRKGHRKTTIQQLNSEETQACQERLSHLMEVEKLYTMENLSLSMLAEKCGVNPRHLSQIINQILKMSYNDYINTYRVKEAQRLLDHPGPESWSILEIAFKVGFNSKNTFNRAFKQITHMTPSQYKRRGIQSDS